jgi:hypothetical protein
MSERKKERQIYKHGMRDRNNRNQCCGSGILISDPDFYPSRIPDPTTAKKEKWGKICCPDP